MLSALGLSAALSAGACTTSPGQARPTTPVIDAFFSNVRREYSGDRARAIVAFMDQYWRVPGNEGFNASIRKVAEVLEDAGYEPEESAGASTRLTYRIERRSMNEPTWEPRDASLHIVGRRAALLRFDTNRNMLAMYSYSTPPEGVEADVVSVAAGGPADFDGIDVRGKVVFGETSVSHLFREAVQQRGALGVLSYTIPAFNQPERFHNSISFSAVPVDSVSRAWGLRLSYAARTALVDALAAGPVRVRVVTATEIHPADELTLVANIQGDAYPRERFVFSAHVQEPGANDNASGVAALSEVARVLAGEVQAGRYAPQRTVTMLWGDEIRSTARFLEEDSARTAGVRWGLSLDMVGEDTEQTGGTFLIEKMPDPSAVWTRGEDRHSEWGGQPLSAAALTPHYFNDFILNRCLDQAAVTGWVVRTNPFEGGSDHVPFLRAGKPGILLWHFTDVFYHTDLDRIDKVSSETLENVGVCAAVSAMTLSSADGEVARFVIEEVERSAVERLAAEHELSRAAVAAGADQHQERVILDAWTSWYRDALRAAEDIEVAGASPETTAALEAAIARVVAAGTGYSRTLGN